MKILVSDNLSSLGVDILKKEDGFEVDVKTGMSKEELIKVIPEYEGLVVRSATKVTADVIEAANNLRVIGRAGVGVDNIDLDAAGKKGIIVMNAPDGNMITTAEHAMALMMSMSRNIPQAANSLKLEKKWSPKTFMGVELYGKTLGIIGMGRIGQAVAQRGRGFGMKIIYHNRNPLPDQITASVGAVYLPLEQVIREADFLSLHLPYSPAERHLINKERLNMMKPEAYLINTARGAHVDEKSLVAHLKAQKIAGAALDVYEFEPLLAPGLADLDNVTLLPHLGSATDDARSAMAQMSAESVSAVLTGKKPQNLLNPEVFRSA